MGETTPTESADVILVGAGLAGAAAASVLARQGRRVVLIDQRPEFPVCFKAEKIEAHQADLFRKFDLMNTLLPHTGRIRVILDSRDGRVVRRIHTEQYGIFYHDMVNAIRASLPASVRFRLGRVGRVSCSPNEQVVTMDDGERITGRLLVLTTGTSTLFHQQLGLKKDMIRSDQSLAFGFNVRRRDGQPFPFDSVTYHPSLSVHRVAYLTLFPIRETLRANLFLYWSAREEQTRRFLHAPTDELRKLLPRLHRVIGDFEVTGKVDTAMIELYRMQNYLQPGVILLGDAFQSVCPTTASGLSKILADVDVLCHDCIPDWLATPGLGVDKIARFYDSPRKHDVDSRSLDSAHYQRQIAVDTSFPWEIRRIRRYWQMRLTAIRTYFAPDRQVA